MVAFLLTALCASAQVATTFSGSGVYSTGAASNYIVSARGSGAPVITYLNCTGGNADNVATFYSVSGLTVATSTNTTVVIPVNGTNNFASGTVIVIRHLANDTYERRVLTTMTTATEMTTTVAPTTAVAAGDIIYAMTSAGTLPIGTSKEVIASGGCWFGTANMPILIQTSGTTVTNTGVQMCAGYYK